MEEIKITIYFIRKEYSCKKKRWGYLLSTTNSIMEIIRALLLPHSVLLSGPPPSNDSFFTKMPLTKNTCCW